MDAENISELKEVQNSIELPLDPSDDFPFPRMISAGDGRSIIINKKIDVLIVESQICSVGFTHQVG